MRHVILLLVLDIHSDVEIREHLKTGSNKQRIPAAQSIDEEK